MTGGTIVSSCLKVLSPPRPLATFLSGSLDFPRLCSLLRVSLRDEPEPIEGLDPQIGIVDPVTRAIEFPDVQVPKPSFSDLLLRCLRWPRPPLGVVGARPRKRQTCVTGRRAFLSLHYPATWLSVRVTCLSCLVKLCSWLVKHFHLPCYLLFAWTSERKMRSIGPLDIIIINPSGKGV